MPRPRKCRKVGFVPKNPCFHPQVMNPEEMVLCIEELEAIRLSDLMDMDQDEAALSMAVSRGTFQRIIKEAHKKLADALVNGKTIRIQGGDYQVTADRLCCREGGKPCSGRSCSRHGKCEGGNE